MDEIVLPKYFQFSSKAWLFKIYLCKGEQNNDIFMSITWPIYF